MLLDNPKHRHWHDLAPQDIKWGATPGLFKRLWAYLFGGMQAVCTFSVTRSTIDQEQMTFSCPIFANDDRETLDNRLGMLMSVAQERLDDANEAWTKAREEAEAEMELEKNLRGKPQLSKAKEHN